VSRTGGHTDRASNAGNRGKHAGPEGCDESGTAPPVLLLSRGSQRISSLRAPRRQAIFIATNAWVFGEQHTRAG